MHGMGGGGTHGMEIGPDNTPGWAKMSSQGRDEHRRQAAVLTGPSPMGAGTRPTMRENSAR